jgi:hypothetical protein
MEDQVDDKERFFSVELKSKADLKSVTLANGSRDSVLIEGTIGELVQATFVEDEILEIVGKTGTLRINLKEEELNSTEKNGITGGEIIANIGNCRCCCDCHIEHCRG